MEYRETLSFDDVLLVPRFSNLSSRNEVDINSNGYELPIAMSPMDLITSPEMINLFIEKGGLATVHRYFKSADKQLQYVKDCDNSKLYFAIGSIKKYKDWISYLYDKGVRKFMVDMAHGDSRLCTDTIKYIKSNFTETSVIAGNVVTKAALERLQIAGADGIRVGFGSGSICSTRLATGFGVPQFTAILDCAKMIKDNVLLIADGGIKNSGDIAKAMAAGADLCMLGKILAGTDLALGQYYDQNKCIISEDSSDKVYRKYHGMASNEARKEILSYASVEGVSGLVPYIGSTKQLLKDIKLNLQASLSYAGVRNWKDFKRKVKIVKVSPNSTIESQTHIID